MNFKSCTTETLEVLFYLSPPHPKRIQKAKVCVCFSGLDKPTLAIAGGTIRSDCLLLRGLAGSELKVILCGVKQNSTDPSNTTLLCQEILLGKALQNYPIQNEWQKEINVSANRNRNDWILTNWGVPFILSWRVIIRVNLDEILPWSHLGCSQIVHYWREGQRAH